MDVLKREQELKTKIAKMHPTYENLVDAYMTALGNAAQLTVFLNEVMPASLPLAINYSIALVASEMFALLSNDPDVEYERQKAPLLLAHLNEQREESLRRKLISIVQYLNEYIAKEELNGY